MKKVLLMPVLAAALLAAACGDDSDPTTVETAASVRFFNATTGMTGSGGFTTNGRFASGSALGFAQASSACAAVEAGTTAFGFGAANAGGTALSGTALATLDGQGIATGGNFTVVARGTAESPTLLVLDNSYAGTLTAGQAAVRFVNLTTGAPNPLVSFIGTIGAGGTLHQANMSVGAPTAYAVVPSGANSFTILHGHDIVLTGSAATLSLQGGSVNTLAVVRNAAGGFQLVNLPRCS